MQIHTPPIRNRIEIEAAMALQDDTNAYGKISRINHWLGALLVLALLGIGLYFEDMPKGDTKRFWIQLHLAFGTVALLALGFRIVWRIWSTSPRALPQAAAWQTLSKAVHWLLLIGIAILIVTGPLSLWSVGRPFGIYDWLSFPSPLPEFRALHKPLENIHGLASKIMLLLIGLHLAGVLKHVVIDRDGSLRRMLGRPR